MSGLRRTRAQPPSLAGLASPAESPTGGFWLAVRRRRGPCGWPYDVDRGLLVGRTPPVGQPETPCQQHLANQKPPVSSTWPTRNPLSASGAGEDEARGGDAGAGGDEDVLGVGDLVDRRAADLADRLGDAVHAVDVGLAELTAVGVQGQPAADLDRAVGDERGGLAPAAEAELLELH